MRLTEPLLLLVLLVLSWAAVWAGWHLGAWLFDIGM